VHRSGPKGTLHPPLKSKTFLERYNTARLLRAVGLPCAESGSLARAPASPLMLPRFDRRIVFAAAPPDYFARPSRRRYSKRAGSSRASLTAFKKRHAMTPLTAR
jgi:hypothetical protein